MIGYADCDDKDTEILAGYKVPLESSHLICYSNDVVWLKDLAIDSIPGLISVSGDDLGQDIDYEDSNSEISEQQSVLSEQDFYSAEESSDYNSDFIPSNSEDSVINIVNLIIKGKYA